MNYIIYIILFITTTTTTQCKLLEHKYGICASGWKEKHHQRKLQWVKPPPVQVVYLCQLLREKHHHRKLVLVTTTVRTRCKGQGARCKGQDQLRASQSGMQQQHATPTTTSTEDRAWKKFEFCTLTQVTMIAALCTPPAPVLILNWSVEVVVGVACCCCIPLRLALSWS